MNIVFAIKIFASLLIVMLGTRALLGKGLREITTPRDWKAAWITISGILVISCFSWRTPLFFVTLSLWAIYVPRLFGDGAQGRLPAYALLACVCPQFQMELTNIGPVQDLLHLDAFRILEILILVPEAWSLLNRHEKRRNPAWLQLCDVLTYGYLLYWTLQLYGQLNASSLARESLSGILDTALPYYTLSRACVRPELRRRVLSMFLLGAAFESVVAIAEALSRHLLYGQLQYLYEARWNIIGALMRGSLMRAQAGLSGPLVMAVLSLFAIGVWFALRPAVRTRAYSVLGLALLGGLIATISRGPTLALLILVVGVLGLRYISERKFLLISLAIAVVASVSWKAGLGDLIVGLINSTSADETADFNVRYREELLSTSLALIQQSPWFGVPNYMQALQSLRQGDGIVDLVNTYLVIALNVGLFGVALFVLPYSVVLWKQGAVVKQESPETRREGQAWNPLMLAVLAAVFTVSPVSIIHHILVWMLALAVARLQEGLPQRLAPGLAVPQPV
jgi:O-antigen ligase